MITHPGKYQTRELMSEEREIRKISVGICLKGFNTVFYTVGQRVDDGRMVTEIMYDELMGKYIIFVSAHSGIEVYREYDNSLPVGLEYIID